MDEKKKGFLINLAASVVTWLIFAALFSAVREDVSFLQGLVNPIGIAVAIFAFVSGLVKSKKKGDKQTDDTGDSLG